MNAVILAAGVGLRMREVALQGHKALLPIGGIAIIERTIKYLIEAKINDITIITGHMKDAFIPLREKYHVKLLHNKKYSMNNNLYSMELALHLIGDTFIIHGDVVLFKNIFKQHEDKTFFYTILKESKGVPLLHAITNKQRVIQDFAVYAGCETITTLLGISYWTKQDGEHLRRYFEEKVSDKIKKKANYDWEQEILLLSKEIPMEAHQIDRKYAKDINLMRDYLEACYIYEQYWKK